ncbi:MAG: serine/threonine-protein kinase [Acidobacteriota bacterium]
MDSGRWREIEDAFHRASSLPREEQAEFLEALRRRAPDIARHVEPMLAMDGPSSAQLGGILDTAIWDTLEQLPKAIGPYEIVSRIGSGGFSSVYLARNRGGSTPTVAVKVLRRGLSSPDSHGRLRQEGEILARLHHPNIARLLDYGSSPRGEPYFVMEFIDGEPIDVYCDRRRLSVEQRLRLFRAVCSAVDYAHQNLVIHRDIKPSNLLVTADGVPKLLDFGIAKLLDPAALRVDHVETSTGGGLMTPDFASPEQVREEPLTTATDVYSLGVLLYRLVAGRAPYRFPSRSPRAIEKTVSTVEPPAPSQAAAGPADPGEPTVAVVAEVRGTAPRQLRSQLLGDLDSIVLMALAKMKDERYSSVKELSQDLGRHLSSEPVTARRITPWYRARRFVRRHRVAVTVSAAILVAMASAVVVTTGATLRADEERDRAERHLAESRQVVGFLIDLFEVPDPQTARGRDPGARELLDRGTLQIADQLQHQPIVRATLMATMGEVYLKLGDLQRSRELLGESLELRRTLLPAADPSTIDGALALSRSLLAQGENEKALELLRGSRMDLAAAGRSDSTEDARALAHLSTVHRQMRQLDAAEDVSRRALQIQGAQLAEDDPDLITSLAGLGQVMMLKRDFVEAEDVFRDVLRRRRSRFGDPSPYVAVDLGDLAGALYWQERFEEAEALAREAIDIRARLFGDDHWIVARSYNNLAQIFTAQGRPGEALPLMEDALEIARSRLGPGHPRVPNLMVNLARAYQQAERAQEAEDLYLEALASHREILGENHRATARNLMQLAHLYDDQRRDAEALEALDRALAGLRASLPEGDYLLSHPLYRRGKILARRGDCRGAIPALEEAWRIRRSQRPEGHDSLRGLEAALATCGATAPYPKDRSATPRRDTAPTSRRR